MTQTEALKMALEAYLCREMPAGTVIGDPKWWVPRIANTIKEALAQPEQEPVGVVCVDISNAHMMYGTQYLGQQPDKKTVMLFKDLELGTQFYTTQPQRKPLMEWQTIETAPKTGRELILLLTPSKWPQIAYSKSWWTTGFSVENKPTHWMPIPPIEAAIGIKDGS